MAQEQVIEATILGVQPDGNGWVKIQTDQGEFSTKFPEPVAEAQAHLGQRVPIAIEVGQAKPKADGSGYWPAPQYFKKVVQQQGYQQPQPAPFAGQVQPQLAPQALQQPAPSPPAQPAPSQQSDQTREMRIMRQTAGKLAVATMPLVPSEQRTFQNQIAVAEAWVRYFVGGTEGVGIRSMPEPPTQEQQMSQMSPIAPDDDIPF